MRDAIDPILRASGGAATRADLLTRLTRGQLDDELARGHVVSPFPRAYVRPWDADVPEIRERAAVLSVGPPAALSHVSALRRLGLPTVDDEIVHVITPARRHPVGRQPSLRVHRTRVRTPVSPVDGVRTVEPAFAITRSWSMLPRLERPAPAIVAVRDKIVTIDALVAAFAHTTGMPDRAGLQRVVGLLESGCESQLEMWGLLGVFNIPELSHGSRQRVVDVRGRRYRVDLAFDVERLAVEMDGERWHSKPEQREKDRRRDAALASVGWLTLRFSWNRLHFDVDGCRRDTLATLATRRQLPQAG